MFTKPYPATLILALGLLLPVAAAAQLDVTFDYDCSQLEQAFYPVGAANMDLDSQQEIVLIGANMRHGGDPAIVRRTIRIVDGSTGELEWQGRVVTGLYVVDFDMNKRQPGNFGYVPEFCDINGDGRMELLITSAEGDADRVQVIGLDLDGVDLSGGAPGAKADSGGKKETPPRDSQPVDARAEIEIHLQHDGPVKLFIYNMQGEVVCKLLDQYETEGKKVLTWDGKDDAGRPLPTGEYFYRLDTFEDSPVRQSIILR